MDVTSMNTYLQTQYANKQTIAAAESINNSISGISSNSTKEEIEDAVKDFETYMVEQVIKEMKESFTDDDEEDSTISMYTDYFMDSAISDVASKLVDQLGDSVTDDFVQQIMRNYGITGVTSGTTEDEGVDAATVSDEIAKENSSKVTEVLA